MWPVDELPRHVSEVVKVGVSIQQRFGYMVPRVSKLVYTVMRAPSPKFQLRWDGAEEGVVEPGVVDYE